MKKPLLILIYGRSCVGKTTIVRELQKRYPNTLHEVVSTTTREMRPGEVDGLDYHFIPKWRFELKALQDVFIESVEYNDNYYGISKSSFDYSLDKVNIAIIEPDGVKQIKDKLSDSFYIVTIKLEENDHTILERFMKRGDPKVVVFERFPKDKIKFAEKPYDYMVNTNADIVELIINKHRGA